jgi:hypothetical protein
MKEYPELARAEINIYEFIETTNVLKILPSIIENRAIWNAEDAANEFCKI